MKMRYPSHDLTVPLESCIGRAVKLLRITIREFELPEIVVVIGRMARE